MTDLQNAFKDMGSLTGGFMVSHSNLMDGIKGVEPTRTEILNGITELESLVLDQNSTTIGITSEKNLVKSDLIDEAKANAVVLMGMATSDKNQVLLKEIGKYSSGLASKSRPAILKDCRWIYGTIQDNLTGLAGLGLDAASQVVFKAKIDAFDASLSAAQTRRNAVSKATARIKVVIKQLDAALKTMDLLVGSLLKTNAAFVADYMKVREVITPPSRKVAAIVTVMMEGTNEPLANALLESSKVTVRTGKSGRAQIRIANEGSDTFMVSRPGCEPKPVTVNFINGETTRLVITLKAA